MGLFDLGVKIFVVLAFIGIIIAKVTGKTIGEILKEIYSFFNLEKEEDE